MLNFQHDYRKDSSEPVRDLNVVPVYKELKITGYNVNITVPDDGIEYTHPEIFPRYVSLILNLIIQFQRSIDIFVIFQNEFNTVKMLNIYKIIANIYKN